MRRAFAVALAVGCMREVLSPGLMALLAGVAVMRRLDGEGAVEVGEAGLMGTTTPTQWKGSEECLEICSNGQDRHSETKRKAPYERVP